jgi:hypothetical protein
MTLQATETAIRLPGPDVPVDEAQLAVVAFLARYSGRTLEAYRHDLRVYFQWALDNDLAVLAATRAHVELYRCSMEERGLAASTIDRRLSTVCGFYRFAHIDGRIVSNPAQYVRRPKVQPNEGHGMDRGELGTFLFTTERFDRAHAALAVLLGLNGLRVSEACATNIEDLGFHRGHRTLKILARATSPPPSRSSHGPLARSTSPSESATKAPSCDAGTTSAWTVAPRTAGSGQSANEPVSARSTHTCSAPGSSWPLSTPASRSETSRSPPATPTHALQPSTTGDERTSIATPPTSWSPSSLVAEHATSGTSGIAVVAAMANVMGHPGLRIVPDLARVQSRSAAATIGHVATAVEPAFGDASGRAVRSVVSGIEG